MHTAVNARWGESLGWYILGPAWVVCVLSLASECPVDSVPPLAGHHRSGGAADHADAGERRAEPPELLPVQAAGWGLRRERRPSAARPGRGQAAAGGGRPWNASQQPETGSWQPVVSDGQATLNYAKVVVIGTLQSFCTFRSNIERYFYTTSRYSSHTKTQGCK